jgi:uncharacterized membrane protein
MWNLRHSPFVACIVSVWRWLERYPVPEKMPWTRRCWVALGGVTLAVLFFCGYFIVYLTQMQAAFQTNAEDLGIMDQALWTTVHGQLLHQTICNVVSDTNCAGPAGIMRFAIHFEPIMLLISLLYLICPDPRTLLVFQTIVVALGAYPAFLLARRRLRHPLLAVAAALLYLLYPAQQQATTNDFHAVTLTATFLLWMIYWMYTQRTAWMFVFALLAVACKEEISLVIVMLGLWSTILQHRWRSGLVLVVGGLLWFFLAVSVIMPHFSPTGRPLLIERFSELGSGPVQVLLTIVSHPLDFLRHYVFEPQHSAYLRILFIPALFLPVLAPWVMVTALPALLLNLMSGRPQMYSGLYQYNAEIVPILLFATIEALRQVLWIGRFCASYLQAKCSILARLRVWPAVSLDNLWSRRGEKLVLCLLWGLSLVSALHYDRKFFGKLPFSTNFVWPTTSSHTRLAEQFVMQITPTASVSAQSALVPHISQREAIYLFPYVSDKSEYIFLDTTSDIYPYVTLQEYQQAVQAVLSSGQYGIVRQEDGLLLLKRGLPPPSHAMQQSIQRYTQENFRRTD